MCGIIGYTGHRNAEDVLIKGLSRLEYRGYDSAGIAVINNGNIRIVKKQGKLSVLRETLRRGPVKGTTGVGHTRWATHGVPNDANAHPHLDVRKHIAVVHNGIIENYQELKKKLLGKGYKFTSETDSETIAHLIADEYKGDLAKAVRGAVRKLEGSFAIAVTHRGEDGRIVGARKDSPLVAGIGKDEYFLASDIPAILDYTKDVIYLENGEVIDMQESGVKIYDAAGNEKKKKISRIKWDISQAEKGGYKHFMLKEIFEQPEILRKIAAERIKGQRIVFDELSIPHAKLKRTKNIAIVACGTAYHAGMVGKYLIEKIAKIPVWVDQASEFRYRSPLVDKDTLMVVVSQSGETADTLAALREAKKRGATILAVCNVVGSSIARESDGVIFIHAGPEIAVASTKAYTAQIAVIHLFAYYLAGVTGKTAAGKRAFLAEFRRLPQHVSKMLKEYHSGRNKVARYAEKFHKYFLARNSKSFFLYLARNVNCPNAMEGALKLKEISYVSAEGYPAGEMKHGPIALIDENPWVVCIAVASETYDKMLSNIQEIKARGGIVIAVISEGDKLGEDKTIDYSIEIPRVPEEFSPIPVVIPLQLLAYYIAEEFGYDIDQPRNLAKSVTVE